MAFDLEQFERAINDWWTHSDSPVPQGFIAVAREVARIAGALEGLYQRKASVDNVVHDQGNALTTVSLQVSEFNRRIAAVAETLDTQASDLRIVDRERIKSSAELTAQLNETVGRVGFLTDRVGAAPDKEELDTLRKELKRLWGCVGPADTSQFDALQGQLSRMRSTADERLVVLADRLRELEEIVGHADFNEVPPPAIRADGAAFTLKSPQPPAPPLPRWSHLAIQRTANGWVVSAPEWTQGGPYKVDETYVFTDWTELQRVCRQVLERAP